VPVAFLEGGAKNLAQLDHTAPRDQKDVRSYQHHRREKEKEKGADQRRKKIAPNTELPLPLWMVRDLWNRGCVRAKIPQEYRANVQNSLRADPGCVFLPEHFYSVGLNVFELFRESGLQSLPDSLSASPQSIISILFSWL